MKIAVLSDSHDHIWNMQRMIAQARKQGVGLMIHCGDLISPFMLEEMDSFTGNIHLVAGNNTGDQILLMKRLKTRPNITFHGLLGQISAGSMRIAFVHAPDIAASIAKSGDFHLVCYGHTHLWHKEEVGKTILLNPGEIMGKKEPAGWALVDTETGEITQILT